MFNNVYRRHHFHPVFECFAELFIFQWPTVPWQLCTRWWFLVNVFFSILRRSFPIFRRLFSMLWDNSKYWEVLFSILWRWFKISWTSFLILQRLSWLFSKSFLILWRQCPILWRSFFNIVCLGHSHYCEHLFSILWILFLMVWTSYSILLHLFNFARIIFKIMKIFLSDPGPIIVYPCQ